eukprot:s3017_g3.t1
MVCRRQKALLLSYTGGCRTLGAWDTDPKVAAVNVNGIGPASSNSEVLHFHPRELEAEKDNLCLTPGLYAEQRAEPSTILFGDKLCWRCKQALPHFPAKLRAYRVTYQRVSGDQGQLDAWAASSDSFCGSVLFCPLFREKRRRTEQVRAMPPVKVTHGLIQGAVHIPRPFGEPNGSGRPGSAGRRVRMPGGAPKAGDEELQGPGRSSGYAGSFSGGFRAGYGGAEASRRPSLASYTGREDRMRRSSSHDVGSIMVPKSVNSIRNQVLTTRASDAVATDSAAIARARGRRPSVVEATFSTSSSPSTSASTPEATGERCLE